MMRTSIFLLFALITLWGCNKRSDVLVTGEIKGLTQSEITVYGFRPDSTEAVRKIPVREDKFNFTLTPDSIWPLVIILDGILEIPVFAAVGDEIQITGDKKNPTTLTVEGGDKINHELNLLRQEKETLESFLETHPDHPVSAWLILNEALSKYEFDTSYLKKLLKLVTPRIAESNLLSPLRKELERQFSTNIEIPYYLKSARSIIRVDNEKIDSVFTHEELKNQIDTLINHK